MNPHWFQQAAINALLSFDYGKPGAKRNPLIGLPTGTGKSVVIALFIWYCLTHWPNQRFVMLTHVSELIAQNTKRILQAWPLAPVGVHAAKLKQREVAQPIICGSIQTLYDCIGILGRRDVLFIDEAHLVGDAESAMYAKAIATLRDMNPDLVVIGLTATMYRMKMGSLLNGGIFTDIAFDMTDIDGFNRLIAEGFICPLYPKSTKSFIDVSGVGISNGDYKKGELEKATDKREVLWHICKESVEVGDAQDRHKWLAFAAGVGSADHMAEMLTKEFGVKAVSIHSKITDTERRDRLQAFEEGDVRCVVNQNVLTVGYDYPPIDMLIHARKTLSAGLWVQMNGRGTRTSPETGKTDCIALDFARNTPTLGPINDPKKPKPKGQGTGDAPVRICEACGTYNHASARKCFCCGAEFVFHEKLIATSGDAPLIRGDAPIVETFEVSRVLYRRHVGKSSGRACLQCMYITNGIQSFTEYVHLDAGGLAGHKARDWFRMRHDYEPPKPGFHAPFATATDAALSVAPQFKQPKRIRVWINRPNPEIQSVEF